MDKYFKTRRDRKAWEALSPFLNVDLRRNEDWDISFSVAEADVLAWIIVSNFKVRKRKTQK